jgi:MYXO-CTERM domain-containing protein
VGTAGTGGVIPTGTAGATGAGSGGTSGAQSTTGDGYRGKVIVRDSGCGCAVAPLSPGPAALLLLGAILTVRRKRRR